MKAYPKYKPSNIEWVGEIPEHWKIRKLKYELLFLDSKRIPLSAEERGKMVNKEYDYYGASGVIDKVENYIFDDTLILLGEDGANLLTRSTPLAFIASGKFWVNNHAHILKPKKGNIKYFVNLLESLNYDIYVTGSAQPKLTQENLENIFIPIPKDDEQNQIVQFIECASDKVAQTIFRIEKEVVLLQEYRTSLISEVVTGKIDVREAA